MPLKLRALCLAVVVTLLLTGAVQAHTAGIVPGDSMTYSYSIFTTYATPNGNISSTSTVGEQIDVLTVNTAGSLGDFGYSLNVISLNETAITNSTEVKNLTTIFNPFDNLTYTGNLGFWPVIYTDLSPGSVTNLELNETSNDYNGSGYFTVSTAYHINASLAKSAGLIDVNMSITPLPVNYEIPPASFYMRYNATTGVMESMKQVTEIEVEKVFTYTLVGFSTPPPNYTYLVGYAAVVLVAVVGVVELVRRKSKKDRKDAKMREKFK